MCTYHGILEEYPLISIDCFETHNYTSTMFFITHIHMDHLVGLERPDFGKYVAKINAPIYMSEISKQLLSTMAPYRHLIPYFKSVPIDQPFQLTIQSNDPVQAKKKEGADHDSIKNTLSSRTPDIGETILVTCFGSGHCPGSVMIWIEGQHGNVLFTGDFRLYRGQTKRITHLHRRRTTTNDGDDPEKCYIFKPIDNLYIDMTFFRPDILHIPTREVSCEALILWIKGLIADKSNTANIYFKTSARVGYEQIYRALYDGLGMRIHVEQGQYDFYSCIPVIQECLTTDPSTTRLHACRTSASNFAQPCAFFRNCDKPIRVLLSIMWFTDQIAAGELLVEYHKYHSNFEQSVSTSSKRYFLGFQDYGGEGVDVSYADKYLSYRLCYSLHSSFSEIVDVLKTLKPKRVTPIAAPFTSQLTPKRLFQIVDHYIKDPNRTTLKLNEKIQRKPVNQQLQIKHRYESFPSKTEKKRKKKLLRDEQQRKDDGDELDLDVDHEGEKLLLQRVNSLRESNQKKVKATVSNEVIQSMPKLHDEKVKFDNDPQIQTTVKCETPSDTCQISSSDDRERTLSDASSATVDYDFDSETYIMPSIALTVLTLTLGMFFIFVGQFKLTPKFFPDVHEDMRREFGRVNKVFPFYEQTGWRPFAKNYRLAVGITEVVCGAILILIPGPLKQVANVVLLITMLGAVYTHYVLHDKFERIAPGLVFSLLLLTRLIIYRQVTQREKRSGTNQKPVKPETEEEVGQASDEQESASEEGEEEEERQEKTAADKKKDKKNK